MMNYRSWPVRLNKHFPPWSWFDQFSSSNRKQTRLELVSDRRLLPWQNWPCSHVLTGGLWKLLGLWIGKAVESLELKELFSRSLEESTGRNSWRPGLCSFKWKCLFSYSKDKDFFSLFFSRNLQCLVCILHIQHILPTQPILNCQYPLLTGSHHIEWLVMYQYHWPFQESVYDSGFSRTVLFNLSIPFFFICLFIFATLEAVACSLCSVFT